MKRKRFPGVYWLFTVLVTAFIASTLNPASSQAQSDSQVRIVRLSFVSGTVTMYRPDAGEWARVYVNTPIQQGFKLATEANSFAEVEFENGSTARLGQSSELDFTGLSLSAEGGSINHLTLARGYATFAVVPERGAVYQIRAAGSTYNVPGRTMFRIDLGPSGQRLEVFKGHVQVRGPYGNGTVAQNQLLELTPGSANAFQLTSGITEDAWDRWVDKRQQAETVASKGTGPAHASLYAGSPFYGWNDLAYFGSWNYLPGFGSCWSPMMGAGWTPYSIGRWSWYPGFGYTWISGLPWGWLPFHYGSWIYPADVGWCWMPGDFSTWSPALVTWYQGPGWVSWTPRPRTYRKPPGFSRPERCPSGQNCSVSVSNNTFRGGRLISPIDVLRVHPFRERRVSSPTLPLTRNLRLPGPASAGPSANSTTGTDGRPGFRIYHIRTVAPTRVFSRGAIRGAWNVQPHAPAVFDRQTQRFINGSGPALRFLRENSANPGLRLHGSVRSSTTSGVRAARPGQINNDVLLRGRTALGRSGSHPRQIHGQLTAFPISRLGTESDALRRSRGLMPTARLSRAGAGMRSSQEPRMPHFHQSRFFGWFHSRQNAGTRGEMGRRSGISRRRGQQFPSSRRSAGGFGRGQSMGQSHRQTGTGMRSGGFGGMRSGGFGGGMRSSGMGGGMHSGGMGGGMGGGAHSGGMGGSMGGGTHSGGASGGGGGGGGAHGQQH